MGNGLTPTLWRTCRMLANQNRLAVLHLLFEHGEMTVSEMSARTHHSMDVTSTMLRQLQARGLLRTRRTGRWVYYRPAADPLVAHARELLTALRPCISTPSGRRRAFRDLTAFTHPRRIALVRAMASGIEEAGVLRRACAISEPAFHRQVGKLMARGVVRKGDRRGAYWLAQPQCTLSRCLLKCSLSSE